LKKPGENYNDRERRKGERTRVKGGVLEVLDAGKGIKQGSRMKRMKGKNKKNRENTTERKRSTREKKKEEKREEEEEKEEREEEDPVPDSGRSDLSPKELFFAFWKLKEIAGIKLETTKEREEEEEKPEQKEKEKEKERKKVCFPDYSPELASLWKQKKKKKKKKKKNNNKNKNNSSNNQHDNEFGFRFGLKPYWARRNVFFKSPEFQGWVFSEKACCFKKE